MKFHACAGRDVRPNKTTQTPLFPMAPFWAKAGAYRNNGVDVRSTHRSDYVDADNSANIPTPFISLSDAFVDTHLFPGTFSDDLGLSVDGYAGLNSRPNKYNLRHTQKDTGMLYTPNRPMMANTHWGPQYGNFGKTESRRLIKDIHSTIDPVMISAWFNNPYTVPINPPLVGCSGGRYDKSFHTDKQKCA